VALQALMATEACDMNQIPISTPAQFYPLRLPPTSQQSSQQSNQSRPHQITPINMKHCTICGSDASSLRISPQHGQYKHKDHERACDECWEAWISLQVEENKPDEIRCMFTGCTSMLDFEQIKKLARQLTVRR
jgi:hypothetical protein